MGLAYSSPLLREWLWGLSLSFNHLWLQASYRAREPLFLQSPSDSVTVPVEMRNRGKLALSSLLLWGYLRWRPTPWLVFSAGPTVALPLSTLLDHTKELLQASLLLPTGEMLYMPDTALVVETTILPRRVQWGTAVHAGTDILITYDWWLSFGFHWLWPLSTALPPPATARLWQWYLSLSLGKAYGK